MQHDTGKAQHEVIQLTHAKPFAIGGRRVCYVHPHEPNKCIKIPRRDEKRTVRVHQKRKPIPQHWRREYDNNAHEYQVLQRLFARVGPNAAQHLPRAYGYVDTDLGPGLTLDLVRDADGLIARSLRELISQGHPPTQFHPAFDDLARFLLNHHIVTRALLDHNIAAQHLDDGGWRLVIIDGLGDPAWLPWGRWCRPIARRRIRRRLTQCRARLDALAATGGVSEDVRAQSTWDEGFLRHRGK